MAMGQLYADLKSSHAHRLFVDPLLLYSWADIDSQEE